MMAPEGEITLLLRRLENEDSAGRKATYDRLMELVYDDLRQQARRQFGRKWNQQTMQPTALVHEAYQRLIGYEMTYENREHFLNVAAAAMRRLLVDEARRKKAGKRWGNQERAALEDQTAVATLSEDPVCLIELDRALQGLKPEQVRLIELRYFLGLSMDETAAAMHIEPEALKKRWRVVKLLLYDRLKHSSASGPKQ